MTVNVTLVTHESLAATMGIAAFVNFGNSD
jgi:hypothetical protein